MAPKRATRTASVVTPTMCGETQVKICDISLHIGSGWRALADRRVTELRETFASGLYGVGLLRRPSIVVAHGRPKMDGDGNTLLLDGKHTFAALAQLAKFYEEEEAKVADEDGVLDLSSWSPLLLKAITEGVTVDMVEFPEDDADLRMAYCVQMHDEATNKYKATALKDMADMAERYRVRAPGGSWDAVRDSLLTVYGQNRRTFVHRILVVAQMLTPAVLAECDRHGVPNSYIYDNKFFVGHGPDAASRLSEKSRMAVLEMYGEEVSKGQAFSKVTFQTDLCKPVKHAEIWVRSKSREFGALTDSPAFRRVEDFLLSPRARSLILTCMRQGVRLEGNSLEAPGIDQCRIIVAELRATLNRGTEGGVPPAAAGSPAAICDDNTADPAAVGDTSMLAGVETVDTAHAAAVAKTDAALARVNFYNEFSELSGVLTRTMTAAERVVFFIDFPTSKARVPLARLDEIGQFLRAHGHADKPTPGVAPLKVRIFIPAGNRIDLVSAIQGKLATACPTLQQFFVPLTCGPFQGRRRHQYMICAMDTASAKVGQVPNSIDALAVRARKGELTRLRCLDKNCRLRSAEERQSLDAPDATDSKDAELDKEHYEVLQPDQIEEDEGGDEPVVEGIGGFGGEGRTLVRDLWPFSMPKDFYKSVLTGILGSEVVGHMVYMTSTAHPAALLAGRDLQMAVHCLQRGVANHCAAHGQEILKDTIFREHHAAERASTQHEKRVLEGELQFAIVKAPTDQPVRFDSVPPTGGCWRSGINLCPTSDYLESTVPKLFASELEEMGLSVVADGSERRLIAAKSLREEDVVGCVSALFFSSATSVAEFLNIDGNAALLEGPLIKITGIVAENPDGDSQTFTQDVFAIPTGVARLLADFRGQRKFPNVAIVAAPERGPNDGMLSLKVSTRNGCGIAAGSVLVCDFGDRWIRPCAVAYTPAKKFRGLLQAMFDEQAKAAAPQVAYVQPVEEPALKKPRTGAGAASVAGAQAGALLPKAVAPAAAPAAAKAAAPVAPAAPPAPLASVAPPAAASVLALAAVSNTGAPGGESILLNTVDELEICVSGTGVTVKNLRASSRKISPKTVLATFTAGRLDETPAGIVTAQFVFKRPSEQVVSPKGGKHEVLTLVALIQGTVVTAIYQHGKFPAGAPPSALSCKKTVGYVPAASEMASVPAMVGGVSNSSMAKVMWMVHVQGDRVMPQGVALVLTKQLVLPASGIVKL